MADDLDSLLQRVDNVLRPVLGSMILPARLTVLQAYVTAVVLSSDLSDGARAHVLRRMAEYLRRVADTCAK